MRISAKAEYAVRAIAYLALQGGNTLQISDIATHEGIPAKFLEQILGELKRAGIISCKRGVGGGCGLARSPEKITVGEIVRLFDGSLGPVGGIERMRNGDGLTDAEHCLRSTWLKVAEATATILDEMDFARVASERRDGLALQTITHGTAWF